MLPVARGFAGEETEKRPQVDHRGDPLPSLARLRIGTTRFRHGGEIVALAFSPDGRSIATLGRDRLLNVWDAASGRVRASYHATDGVSLAFTESGKALRWCDDRGYLYRCDAGQRGDNLDGRRTRIHKFDLGSSERIDAAAFTPDGSVAAVGSSANIVYLWGRKVELKLRDGIQAVALDAYGKRLAVNHGHEGIQLQDISGKPDERRLPHPLGADAMRSLAFSPDGSTLAAGDFDNRIHLWDAGTGRELRVLEGHRRVAVTGKNGVFCLTFSPDGMLLASGAADGTVRIWEVKSGKERACCVGHDGRVRALAFTPDGQTLASAGADGVLRLWHPATGQARGPVQDDDGAVMGTSVSPDGRTVAVVRRPGRLSLWDVTAGNELEKTPNLPEPIRAAVFALKGRTLVAASVTGNLHFWDYDKGVERWPARNVRESIRLLAAGDNGDTVAWCGCGRRVVLWDAKAGKELQQFRPQGNTISDLLISPDGATLFVAGLAGVRLFAVEEKAAHRDLSERVEGVSSLAVSLDGRMLVTGGHHGAVFLWETASGQQRRAMYGGTALVGAAAFSPDVRLLATGSDDGFLRLWDVVTGRRLHTFTGHRGAIIAVAFAEGGSTLITAGRDGTALFWDLPALLEAGLSKTIDLSEAQVQALWRDLGSDAPRAYEALETLRRAPSQSVPFLREHLVPVAAEKRDRRIKELDSDQYEIRIRATNELAQMGKFAEPGLRKLLAEKPTLEARKRAEDLLALLNNPAAMTEHLRALRAVEVLERIGTEPAQKVLQALADGAAEAPLTREANAALARCHRKP
jgi:WD40 repeat protein